MRRYCNGVALVLITADLLLFSIFMIRPWFGSRSGAGVAQWQRTVLLIRLGALISIASLAVAAVTSFRRLRLWLVILSVAGVVFWFTMSIPASDFLAVDHARSSAHAAR
jgi:hypothetical protein